MIKNIKQKCCTNLVMSGSSRWLLHEIKRIPMKPENNIKLFFLNILTEYRFYDRSDPIKSIKCLALRFYSNLMPPKALVLDV